eukprot:403369513
MVRDGGEIVIGTKGTERYFDHGMVMQPVEDTKGFFFATKITITGDQEQGTCSNNRECKEDSQCNSQLGGKCIEGFCHEKGWCPVKSKSQDESFYLNPNIFNVWFKGSVNFPELGKKTLQQTSLFTNFQSTNLDVQKPRKYPKSQATQFSVTDIVSQMDENNYFDYQAIRDSGAIVHAAFTWECSVGHPCYPFLSVKNVLRNHNQIKKISPVSAKTSGQNLTQAGGINETQLLVETQRELQKFSGFETVQYQYFKVPESGQLRRTEYIKSGIKFMIETKGVGRKLAVDSIILQLSLGMALLKLAVIIVDFFMLYIFPKRELYAREKYMKTEDFSEFEERKKHEEEEKERRKIRRRRRKQRRSDDEDDL